MTLIIPSHSTVSATRQAWIKLAWKSLGRGDSKELDGADAPLRQVLHSFYNRGGQNECGFLYTASAIIAFHNLYPNLGGNNDQRFYDLDVSSRNSYVALFLAGVIDQNLNAGQGLMTISSSNPIWQDLANYWLERAWRSRFRLDENIMQYDSSKSKRDMHGLMWCPVSYFITELLERKGINFQSIGGMEFSRIEDLMPTLCQELHDNLTDRSGRYGHTYWGKDSEEWKAYEYGNLPKHMKDNYTLMILSGLATLAEQHYALCTGGKT